MPSNTTALMIAKYFIWKANKEGVKLTNKKLQKLIYYAQAWNMVFKNKPLFDDKIEAWIHGPAVFSIYQEYKKYGFSTINEKVKDIEVVDIPSKDVLDKVWNTYKGYDAKYLEILTHSETPWQKARAHLDVNESSKAIISLEDMKKYYSALLEDQKGKDK